jgi:hypothetical protein
MRDSIAMKCEKGLGFFKALRLFLKSWVTRSAGLVTPRWLAPPSGLPAWLCFFSCPANRLGDSGGALATQREFLAAVIFSPRQPSTRKSVTDVEAKPPSLLFCVDASSTNKHAAVVLNFSPEIKQP